MKNIQSVHILHGAAFGSIHYQTFSCVLYHLVFGVFCYKLARDIGIEDVVYASTNTAG